MSLLLDSDIRERGVHYKGNLVMLTRLLFCLLLNLGEASAPTQAYYAHGWHGGYYLTDERAYGRALERLFELLEAMPESKAVLELEPYTLERMQRGEQFDVERRGRSQVRLVGWQCGGSGRCGPDAAAARTGRLGVRLRLQRGAFANCCQRVWARRLHGEVLEFGGWIRARSGGRGAHLYIDAWDESAVVASSNRRSELVPPDGRWHHVRLEYRVPERAVVLFPQAKIAFEPAEADFDDLSLTVKDTGQQLLVNGGFEQQRRPTLKDLGGLARLRDYVRRGRVELVGGAYTQPIMYGIGAESVVRQFLLGCRAVEESLGVPVRIYAAQEPDMIGQLPQVLRGFGFRGVLYRTHWAIFGSAPSYDAEKVWWIGPDGTRIECVPAPSVLIQGYGLRGPSPAVIEACRRAGVSRPVFSFFGDFIVGRMPDAATVRERFLARSIRIKLVTLAEHFKLTGEPQRDWPDAFERFEFRFPWSLQAGRPQRFDRQAEAAALCTERLFALAGLDAAEQLADLWRLVMIGHHHDVWVCAPVVFGIWSAGYKCYGDVATAAAREAMQRSQRLIDELVGSERGDAGAVAGTNEFVVANVSGFKRAEPLRVELTLPPGSVKSPCIVGPAGKPVPAKLTVSARHGDGSARRVCAWMQAEVPALGYTRYRLIEGEPQPLPAATLCAAPDRITLANDRLCVVVAKDGLLQAYDPAGKPLLRQPAYLAGLFRSGDERSQVEVLSGLQDGPYAVAQVRGRVGHVPFTAELRLGPRSPVVRMAIEFDFGSETAVGEGPDKPRRPPFAHDERKLRLVLPVAYKEPRFYTHGPFELRPVKRLCHVMVRYALAEGPDRGLAAYTDRVTAVVCRSEPPSLEVVLAYGGRFLYAPGRHAPLRGRERYELALYFYEGDAASARVCDQSERLSQPLLALPAGRPFAADSFSRLRLEPEGAVPLTAVYPAGDDIILRLWRPYEGAAALSLEVTGASELWQTDLSGKPKRRLSHGPHARLKLGHNEIVTIHARGVIANR